MTEFLRKKNIEICLLIIKLSYLLTLYQTEAEVSVDGVHVANPFVDYFKTMATKMHARYSSSTQHSELASRTAHAPLLYKCCAVDYIKEENRLKIRKGEYVGKVVTRDTTAEGLVKRDDEDYDNTMVEIFSDETDAPGEIFRYFFMPHNLKTVFKL